MVTTYSTDPATADISYFVTTTSLQPVDMAEKKQYNNILVFRDSDIGVTRITHADFELVAEARQRSIPLRALSAECTTAPTTMMLHTTSIFRLTSKVLPGPFGRYGDNDL